jgi:hypothetical protein
MDSYIFVFIALVRSLVTKLRHAPEPLLLADTDKISGELQLQDTHMASENWL